jgi:hypothetical protein
MSARNCIDLYETVATGSGEPLSVALRGLSEDAGMVVDLNVWGKWRRGERSPPARVVRIINRTIVGRALREAGLDQPMNDATLDTLADCLSPPERR